MQSTRTKLTLARFAQICGMHPLHFWQVRIDTDPFCDQIMFQHEWQNVDHVSREEIARAISEVENKIEDYLGYRLAPSWEIDEWRETTRPFNPELINLSISDVRGYRQTVKANWGYVISGGIEAKTLIDDAVAIAYSDVDSDGYFETATVTVPTTVLDKNEIAIFYPGENGDDEWEIRPTEVSIAGGVATIIFRREFVVIPEKLELFDIQGAEAIGTDNADFLTTVDVYRRYNDPQTQANFLWEPLATGNWCSTCGGTGCTVCAYATQNGCLILRGEPRNSQLGYWPGSWDSVNDVFQSEPWAVGRQPDIVRLYYYSGWRNKSNKYISRLDKDWEFTIAVMAMALLDRPPCDCAKGNWSMWRQDMTIWSGDEDGKPYFNTRYSDPIFDNPFGNRRGEIYAWRRVRDKKIAVGVPVR